MATNYSVFIKMATTGASKTEKDIESIGKASKSASAAASVLTRSLGILAGALAVGAIVKAGDAWITYTNTLRAAGLQGEELVKTQQQLFDISQQTRVSISSTADVYRALKLNASELGASQQDLLTVTRALNEAIIQSGATAQQAKGGIIQLSQVFEKGKLQAQEYNSIVSDFPALGSLLKQAFLQVSDGTETFREQMEKGEITSEAFFKAVQAVAPELHKTQAAMSTTAEQGVTQLSNAWDKLIGSIENSEVIMKPLAWIFNVLSSAISGFSDGLTLLFSQVKDGATEFVSELTGVAPAIDTTSASFLKMGKASEIANEAIRNSFNLGAQQSIATLQDLNAEMDKLSSKSPTVNLSDKQKKAIQDAKDNAKDTGKEMGKLEIKAQSLSQVFETTFASGVGNAMAQLATGTMTAKEAFTQMTLSIIQDMIRIATERAILGLFKLTFGAATATTTPTTAPTTSTPSPTVTALSSAGGVAVGSFAAASIPTQSAPRVVTQSAPPTTATRSSPMVMNLNTTVNHTVNEGTGSGSGEQQNKTNSSQNAQMIANLVNTQVRKEMATQMRVGGMLYQKGNQ
jgi:tape measure domain-containing protein